ncbi:hypothetical protein IW261DRAFT_1632524 [Armillaria novae-zelandiae]|uniref:Uncharacterized protein n=1 Tax=Armillaria novae-zelandiae TaxID=153914 RepID=A0AA39N9C2_9AGAR|nr:hypothetical protein IW261DRAFT_1632524 [Armillaria novae-zelandiae]
MARKSLPQRYVFQHYELDVNLGNDGGPASASLPNGAIAVPALPQSRKCGRPKGSTMKERPVVNDTLGVNTQLRGPGRPRGTGPRQLAQKTANEEHAARVSAHSIQGLHVPGIGPGASNWDALMASLNSSTHSLHDSSNNRPTAARTNSHLSLSPSSLPAPPLLLSASRATLAITMPASAPSSFSTATQIDSESSLRPNAAISLRSVLAHTENISGSALPHHPMPSQDMPEALQFISDSTPASLDSVDSLTAEGLGEDDDESDGEMDERLSTSPKRKHCSYPHWFQRTLDNAIAHIESAQKSTRGRSQVYSAQTFWVPHKSPFFCLQKSSLRPEDLFIPKFFLWDPDNLLSTGISCPMCSIKLNRGGIVRRPW